MPEEKKDKKTSPLAGNAKEPAKKESFTFSDKIKNSKANNKSFAKPSSKIGRDGKPKQTLFERTRRDAPFFIAALIALLLLPFLYKYSGQASEEQLLTPGSESAEFDPDRYGFDTALVEDPDGQIAQLAGRDSLSLIKGFGSNEEDYGRDDMDFDAASASDYASSGEYSSEKSSSSEMDVEDNTTNIYKRRAGAATRAAFRRTKIGALNPTSFRRPGGSRLGINNWGGGLKEAAKRVGSSAPASAPKPVSLQPLRAAGQARSSFGNGAAAAARKSRDNMGKADAREALRDSYVKPVDPVRTGGLDLFSMGPGGGSGKLDRNVNIGAGKEPWWWDMMKTRMQKEWEARFNRKWDWIKWGDQLAQNILGGIINCLLTGEDDGSMGSMFGHGDGGGKVAKCGSLTKEDWENCEECKKYGKFGSHACKAYLGHMSPDASEAKKGWQAGAASGGGKVGFVGARLQCLGIAAGGAGYASGAPTLEDASGGDCLGGAEHYKVRPQGEARKWNTYHFVVARNYVPAKLLNGQDGKNFQLCTQDTSFYMSRRQTAAGNMVTNLASETDNAVKWYLDLLKKEKVSKYDSGAMSFADYLISRYSPRKNKAELRVGQERLDQAAQLLTECKNTRNQVHWTNCYSQNAQIKEAAQGMVELANIHQQETTAKHVPPLQQWNPQRETLEDACVIYVGQGEILDPNDFHDRTAAMLEQMLQHQGIRGVQGTEVLPQLDLMFVESMSSKKTLGFGRSGSQLTNGTLPMPYWQFRFIYMEHYGSTPKHGSKNKVYKRKQRTEDEDVVYGPRCYYESGLGIACAKDGQPTTADSATQAIVYFNTGYKGGEVLSSSFNALEEARANLRVKAQFYPMAGGSGPEQPREPEQTTQHGDVIYSLGSVYSTTTATSPTDAKTLDQVVGRVVWKVYRGNAPEPVTTTTCTVNLSGDPVTPHVPPNKCDPGKVEYDPTEKVAGQCQKMRTCDAGGRWGGWVNNPDDRDCDGPQPSSGAVHFYDRVTKEPCNTDVLNGTKRLNNEATCLSWERCKLTVDSALLLQPLDNDTKQYVARAKAKFDKANEDKKITLSYNEQSLSVANLIDAIMIDPDNGRVPANTVCLLGKTIGANAQDPQAKGFDNIFGAFLAFIGYDAASFPSQRTYNCDQQIVRDLRFLCRSEYYWGGYINNRERVRYEQQVSGANSPWKNFPLKGLLREPLPTVTADNYGRNMQLSDKENRRLFHERYADLIGRDPCNYPSGTTLSRADVLEYINRLCQYGEQQKPKSPGAREYDCTKYYKDGAYHRVKVWCPSGNC